MPDNMIAIEWFDPWEAIGTLGESFTKELQKELSLGHPLYGFPAMAIGHRIDCDDVLFLLGDNTLAVVHLTWSGKQAHPGYPRSELYSSVAAFVENRMRPDAKEYRRVAGI